MVIYSLSRGNRSEQNISMAHLSDYGQKMQKCDEGPDFFPEPNQSQQKKKQNMFTFTRLRLFILGTHTYTRTQNG